MSIQRKTYQPFAGDRTPASRLGWVIGRRELRLGLRKKWVRRLLIASAIPLIVSVVTLYVQIVVQQVMRMELFGGFIFENLYNAQVFFVVLVMAAAGSDLIAKDVATHAHQLYFSRPLSCTQYVLGKLSAIFVILALMVLVPGLLLALAQLLLAPQTDYGAFGEKVVEISIYGLLMPAVAAVFIALLSSFGRRPRYVGLVWVALYFFSDIISAALVNGANFEWARLLSLRVLFVDSGRLLYADDPPDAWPLVILIGLGIAGVLLLQRRVVSLERREN